MENKYNRKHIGKKFQTNQGYEVEIVDGGAKRRYCTIEFTHDRKLGRFQKDMCCIKRGAVKYPKHKSIYNRKMIGQEYTNATGCRIEVVAGSHKRNHCVIRFFEPKQYDVEVRAERLKNGNIKNKYFKTDDIKLSPLEIYTVYDIMRRFILDRIDLINLEDHEIELILWQYPEYTMESMRQLLRDWYNSEFNERIVRNNGVHTVNKARALNVSRI